MGLKGQEDDLEIALSEDTHSYILITCGEPSNSETNKGDMNVEFTYKGPKDLISCLLNDAQNYINDQDE